MQISCWSSFLSRFVHCLSISLEIAPMPLFFINIIKRFSCIFQHVLLETNFLKELLNIDISFQPTSQTTLFRCSNLLWLCENCHSPSHYLLVYSNSLGITISKEKVNPLVYNDSLRSQLFLVKSDPSLTKWSYCSGMFGITIHNIILVYNDWGSHKIFLGYIGYCLVLTSILLYTVNP